MFRIAACAKDAADTMYSVNTRVGTNLRGHKGNYCSINE